jgi:hypothetical protein
VGVSWQRIDVTVPRERSSRRRTSSARFLKPEKLRSVKEEIVYVLEVRR